MKRSKRIIYLPIEKDAFVGEISNQIVNYKIHGKV
jgi:hypothetical protein